MSKFIDEYGLIHAYPNERSENGILFLVENLLQTKPVDSIDRFSRAVEAHEIEPGVYAQNPWSLNDPASHDNVTAIVAYSKLVGTRFHKTLEIFGKFWHPRDVVYYAYLKGYMLAKLLLWIPMVAMVASCLRTYKVRQGRKIEAVDGKLMALIRTDCSDLPITKYICDKILTRKYGLNYREALYRIYFNHQEDHPNIEMFNSSNTDQP